MIRSGTIMGFGHRYESPIQYKLQLDDEFLSLNPLIGESLTITFLGEIHCTHCGRKTRKSYDSFCYPCFKKLPQADLCIMKPHECHYHLGTCRDPAFGESHCMIPHYVYLSVSSGVKVGLTRKSNEWKRWVDQGAVQAVPIAELPNRKAAGELEYEIAQFMADKTDWRKMLKGDIPEVDLPKLREETIAKFPESFRAYALADQEVAAFEYPAIEQVEKLVSYNLDKTPEVQDRLIGIKGNYLLFQNGVLNINKFKGYKIQLESSAEYREALA